MITAPPKKNFDQFLLGSLIFLLVGGYSISRVCTDSLFLQEFDSSSLPLVWLITAFVATGVMAVYNHFCVRFSLLRLFQLGSVASGILLFVFIFAYVQKIPYASYGLYIWREVYMVVLIEIFWSYLDSVYSTEKAKNSFGILLLVSSIGGLLGNLGVGAFATKLGTLSTLSLLGPLLLLGVIIAQFLTHGDNRSELAKGKGKKGVPQNSFQVVWKSGYLVPMMFLIVSVQTIVTLVDYNYNTMLKAAYPVLDVRTAMAGNVHAILDTSAILLQLASGTIFKLIGLGGAFIAIPLLISLSIAAFLALPRFATMITVRVMSKCFDYSIFRAAKEIFYIPLSPAERTQGKAFIDILVYRLTKGSSSLLLLGLVALGAAPFSMHICALFTLIWLILALIIVKRYKSIVDLNGKSKA